MIKFSIISIFLGFLGLSSNMDSSNGLGLSIESNNYFCEDKGFDSNLSAICDFHASSVTTGFDEDGCCLIETTITNLGTAPIIYAGSVSNYQIHVSPGEVLTFTYSLCELECWKVYCEQGPFCPQCGICEVNNTQYTSGTGYYCFGPEICKGAP